MKPCPACHRRIQDAASKCHYCGVVVRPPKTPDHAAPPGPSGARPEPHPVTAFRFTILILVVVAGLAWLLW
jgi:hypothetical protein